MPIDPKFVKKLLITILIIAGLFVGYQLISTDTEETPYELIDGEDVADTEDMETVSATTEAAPLDDDQYGNKIQFNNSFEHTNPGVSSEIIVNMSGFEPGEFTIVYVRFAGTEDYIEAGGQEHTADSDGNISTRFTITNFGDYEVFVTSGETSFVSPTISVK